MVCHFHGGQRDGYDIYGSAFETQILHPRPNVFPFSDLNQTAVAKGSANLPSCDATRREASGNGKQRPIKQDWMRLKQQETYQDQTML
jgi:hypothetical protein